VLPSAEDDTRAFYLSGALFIVTAMNDCVLLPILTTEVTASPLGASSFPDIAKAMGPESWRHFHVAGAISRLSVLAP
jgi:hypothetical protein